MISFTKIEPELEKKKCVQCGKAFTIMDFEKQFFEKRNLIFQKDVRDISEHILNQRTDWSIITGNKR